MTIKEKLELAIANKDWTLVEELTKSLDQPATKKKTPKKKVVKKKVTTKKVPTKRARGPSGGGGRVVDHQEWHNKHLYGPVALPNRPNKFSPEDYKPKRYTVSKDKKNGKFAGKTFESEEAYLKAAGLYSPPVPRKEQVKKMSVVCSVCQRTYKMYPSEIYTFDDGQFRCEQCILSRRGAEGNFDDKD